MSAPVKIERLSRGLVVTVVAAITSTPGAVPGNTTEVAIDLGERVPLNAAVSAGYVGTTVAQRPVTHILSAAIKHDDPTKLVYRWNQVSGAAAAVPAGTYTFFIAY